MYNHPTDKLMGAGHALMDIAGELNKCNIPGLAFVLHQIGEVVFGVGSKIDKEGWGPAVDVESSRETK